MRVAFLFCLLLLAVPGVEAQPVKKTPAVFSCEPLCAELFASIRADPEKMVMRLEEALIINESCAGEIVTAAIDAVNADPDMVRKIVEAALDLSPSQSGIITAAVKNYAPPVQVVNAGEEIRRAEAPGPVRPQALPGEELRRAELPLSTASIPIVEIRRAEAPSGVPADRETQAAEASFDLSQVPKAGVLDSKSRP